MGAPRRSRLRMRTLVTQRWTAIAGQCAAVAICGIWLRLDLPYLACFALIGLSLWLNLILHFASPGQRLALDWETALQLTFDTLQLTGMLYLTGGITNPFSLLLIAPAVLAATTLPRRYALFIGALTIAASVLITFFALPLQGELVLPNSKLLVAHVIALAANVLGIASTAGYAWAAATEAARMELAQEGFDPVFGARPLKRAIQRHIQDAIALKILQNEIHAGDHVTVDAKDGEFVFQTD